MVSLFFILMWAGFIYLGYYLLPLWYLIPAWLILGFVAALLVLIIFLIILMPLMKWTKPTWRFKYYMEKHFANFINLFLFRAIVKVEGKENIPKKGRLTVYANHKSQADPVFVMAALNRGLAFTPKISLYKIPILSQYMSYVGCLPIDRDDNRRTAKTMIQAIKNVEDGLAMLIFPEAGIKTRETELMQNAKGGAYKIGTKSESDFLPITIIGATKLATRKWWQFVKVRVVVHPLIKFEEVEKLSTQELADKIASIVNSKISK